jgi:VIT1/CCC1 family predicted Fe2+/Mn2+ transporter/rubrerythrin
MSDATAEARERLLAAWRGEIEAGAVYELIAQRESDPRRAEILRKMAAAEAGHRGRLEARMRELGIAVPDPGSVRLSLWQRWQARLAPIDRLLAAREAAEEVEVSDTYRRPTGDAQTDSLLRDIRHEERSHGMAVAEMRAGGDPDASKSPEQSRLDRLLSRETWHRGTTGWLSSAIYGANDGLAAVFGIVSGVSSATNGSHLVLTAGLAGAAASALSMAAGAFLAERATSEVAAANLERERQEIADHPEEEKEELSLFYQLKGLSQTDADALAEKLSENPEAMLQVLAIEEFGGAGGGGDPVQAALAGGLSTAVGAILPVMPFFWLSGSAGIIVAAIVSLVAHFAVGATKSLFTLRTAWASGLEMTALGVIVGGGTYLLGLVFPAG